MDFDNHVINDYVDTTDSTILTNISNIICLICSDKNRVKAYDYFDLECIRPISNYIDAYRNNVKIGL